MCTYIYVYTHIYIYIYLKNTYGILHTVDCTFLERSFEYVSEFSGKPPKKYAQRNGILSQSKSW